MSLVVLLHRGTPAPPPIPLEGPRSDDWGGSGDGFDAAEFDGTDRDSAWGGSGHDESSTPFTAPGLAERDSHWGGSG